MIRADDGCHLWTATTGHGEPLVCCHGGPGLWDMFAGFGELLGDAHSAATCSSHSRCWLPWRVALLRWEAAGVGDAAVDPAAQVGVLRAAGGVDDEPALHRPAGHVERPGASSVSNRSCWSGSVRTISPSLRTPTAMLPSSSIANPPNIFYSASPASPPSNSRTRVANPSSYAMAPSWHRCPTAIRAARPGPVTLP